MGGSVGTVPAARRSGVVRACGNPTCDRERRGGSRRARAHQLAADPGRPCFRHGGGSPHSRRGADEDHRAAIACRSACGDSRRRRAWFVHRAGQDRDHRRPGRRAHRRAAVTRALQGRTEFMMAPKLARGARAAAVVFTMAMFTGLASAEEPTPAAVAVAKELIVLKGSTQLWDAVVPGVIEQVKAVFMQTNPALGKELNDVAAQLRTEYAPRASQLVDQVAQLYARTFTEQELKDALTFYKSPLGRKIVNEEPKVLDDGFRRIQQWANKFSEEVMSKMRAEMKKKGYDL